MSWIFFALICMMMTVFKTLLAKRMLRTIEAQVFVSLDVAFCLAYMMPFLPQIDFSLITPRFVGLMFVIAVPNLLAMTYLSKATKEGEISEVAPLLILVPAISALFAPLFLDEYISPLGWLGILTVFLGGYLIKLENLKKPLSPFLALKGDRVTRNIAVAIGISVVNVTLIKWLVLESSALNTLFVSQLTMFILTVPFGVRFAGGLKKSYGIVKGHFFSLGLLGLLSVVSNYSFLTAFDEGGQVAYVLSIKRMSVVFIAGLGMFTMKESVRFGKIVGVGCMVAGGLILVQS